VLVAAVINIRDQYEREKIWRRRKKTQGEDRRTEDEGRGGRRG
jgi:hypothetical protein